MATSEERAAEEREERRHNQECLGCVLGFPHDHPEPPEGVDQ